MGRNGLTYPLARLSGNDCRSHDDAQVKVCSERSERNLLNVAEENQLKHITGLVDTMVVEQYCIFVGHLELRVTGAL